MSTEAVSDALRAGSVLFAFRHVPPATKDHGRVSYLDTFHHPSFPSVFSAAASTVAFATGHADEQTHARLLGGFVPSCCRRITCAITLVDSGTAHEAANALRDAVHGYLEAVAAARLDGSLVGSRVVPALDGLRDACRAMGRVAVAPGRHVSENIIVDLDEDQALASTWPSPLRADGGFVTLGEPPLLQDAGFDRAESIEIRAVQASRGYSLCARRALVDLVDDEGGGSEAPDVHAAVRGVQISLLAARAGCGLAVFGAQLGRMSKARFNGDLDSAPGVQPPSYQVEGGDRDLPHGAVLLRERGAGSVFSKLLSLELLVRAAHAPFAGSAVPTDDAVSSPAYSVTTESVEAALKLATKTMELAYKLAQHGILVLSIDPQSIETTGPFRDDQVLGDVQGRFCCVLHDYPLMRPFYAVACLLAALHARESVRGTVQGPGEDANVPMVVDSYTYYLVAEVKQNYRSEEARGMLEAAALKLGNTKEDAARAAGALDVLFTATSRKEGTLTADALFTADSMSGHADQSGNGDTNALLAFSSMLGELAERTVGGLTNPVTQLERIGSTMWVRGKLDWKTARARPQAALRGATSGPIAIA